MSSRATIDQAIGVIRSRSGASTAEALDQLRETSQNENITLTAIAERLLAGATRRANNTRR